jgi:acetoin utilization deacetylase AcuC-like enzyme
MISYYFRNQEGSLSKIVDEDEAYEDINDIITELTEKHKTPVLAVIQGGKKCQCAAEARPS